MMQQDSSDYKKMQDCLDNFLLDVCASRWATWRTSGDGPAHDNSLLKVVDDGIDAALRRRSGLVFS